VSWYPTASAESKEGGQTETENPESGVTASEQPPDRYCDLVVAQQQVGNHLYRSCEVAVSRWIRRRSSIFFGRLGKALAVLSE
jgi:hypothetical protein